MKFLIAGLGNIGSEYELTRHNIGFLTLDQMANQHKVEFTTDRLAYKAEIKYKGRQLHLIKPTTYMNLSGEAIAYWLHDLKISKENLLVIADDIALPFGSLRIRTKGSSGGHNGLKNIELLLGAPDYARLRFGVGNNFRRGGLVDYVLGNFTQQEFSQLPEAMDRATEIIFSFCTFGPEQTMNLYNS